MSHIFPHQAELPCNSEIEIGYRATLMLAMEDPEMPSLACTHIVTLATVAQIGRPRDSHRKTIVSVGGNESSILT